MKRYYDELGNEIYPLSRKDHLLVGLYGLIGVAAWAVIIAAVAWGLAK